MRIKTHFVKQRNASSSNLCKKDYSPFIKLFTPFLLIIFSVGFSPIAHSQNTFMDFDGTDDYISVPHNASQAITGDITVETWFKLDAIPGDWVRLVGKGIGGSRDYGLWILPNSNTWLFQQYCTGGNLQLNSPITVGQWYHFAAVKNGTNVKLYINGSEVANGTFGTSPCTTTEPLTIGYATFHTYTERPNG